MLKVEVTVGVPEAEITTGTLVLLKVLQVILVVVKLKTPE
jgi:hypothetical protein